MIVAGKPVRDSNAELCIKITTDEAANTISILDTGIGMSKNELVENLGTIALSGSKNFVKVCTIASYFLHKRYSYAFIRSIQKMATDPSIGSSDAQSSIIGQFGVGFYSAFMVSEYVTVESQSANPDTPAYRWTSRGDATFEIDEIPEKPRGTKITMKLKDNAREFSVTNTIKDIITKYSNYVNFPIFLNGKQVNTIEALWAKPRSEITEEQYAEFYKYKSGDFEAPLLRLHFTADAPTNIKALLFVGQSHDEKYGMGRMKPGVDLYSRKVLIESASEILPDWLRFMHGIVDSEDIPLSISRESMQDSALMRRLRAVLTRRILRFFDAEARKNPEMYNTQFFPEFGSFLKEGAITDPSYSADVAKLLRFESSALPSGQMTSFDEYISRMPPGQTAIYYLVAPHRALAETSPYMEAFRGAGGARTKTEGTAQGGEDLDAHVDDVEVLYLYSPMDDFVMNNLREYGGRKLTTAETADINPETLKGLKPKTNTSEENKDTSNKHTALSQSEIEELGKWLVKTFPKRLAKIRGTSRLKASPAVVVDHESASLRRMMRMVEQTAGKESEALKLEQHTLPKQTLEINPSHPIIYNLNALRTHQEKLAVAIAEQVIDNALIAAGLLDDPRTMLPRLNSLLETMISSAVTGSVPANEIPTNDDLLTARWVPPKEQEEREVLDAGEEIVQEMIRGNRRRRQRGEEPTMR